VFTIARRDRNEPLSLGEALEQGAKRRLLLNGKSHRAAVQIPAPSVMLDDGTVERRVRLVRPLERPSIAVEALQATAWRPTEPEAFAVAWEAEVAQLPEFRESTLHIVTGLLLPIWRQLPHDGGRVYRLQTDDGERVIGRQMSPAWVAAASARVPELSPDDAMAGLVGGRMVLHLADGLQLRRVRVMHAHRIELIGFTDTMRDRLTAVYLRNRGIADVGDLPALRFHPTCFYRGHEGAPRETSSALLAAVTDPEGVVTGVLRTWLARDGSGKAPLATPRLSMGRLLGHGVRLGDVQPAPAQAGVLAAGEGLETMLSLRVILPALPVVAALSATHLAGFIPPSGLRRLYIARDNDRVGRRAAEMLGARANAEGIEALVLTPHWDDFNTDLTTLGREALAASLRVQFTPEDVERFLVVDRRPDPRPRQRAPVPDPSSPSAAPGLQNGDGAGSG
jgi:hypothetical protein